jgi:hypothetical protein
MDLLLSICTLLGGIAALLYVIEKYRSRIQRFYSSKREQSETEAVTGTGFGSGKDDKAEEIHTKKNHTFNSEFPKDSLKNVQVEYMAHLEMIGDTPFVLQPGLCGTTGESRRLEGFLIRPVKGDIKLSYMGHLETIGDTDWKDHGTYIGTRGLSKRLEGFAIKVAPEYAEKYDVYYMAHLEMTGDTPWCKNGEFCGTRGQSRRVEAIAVFIFEK